MARVLVSFALVFSLGNPAFLAWANALLQSATADAGNQGAPNGSTPDFGNLWDPNG